MTQKIEYKAVYQTPKKNSSLKKAEKILKKKLKLQRQSQQKRQSFPNLKLSTTEKTSNTREKSLTQNKILIRSKSEQQYSSFSKHNYRMGNLEQFNRSMHSKTQHYQRILSLDRKINSPPIVVDMAMLSLRKSACDDRVVGVKSSVMQRLKTQENRHKRHTVKPYLNSSRLFQPNINSKLRLTTLFHETQPQKQQHKLTQSPFKKEQKVQNFYLRKEMSKKTMFSKMIEKNYTSHLPFIKQKKIHLR